jgi:alpha-N-acetylglucosaminidase
MLTSLSTKLGIKYPLRLTSSDSEVTLWGPTGQINDYASKQWAGLVGTYYIPRSVILVLYADNRWRIFVDYLASTTPQNANDKTLGAQLLQFEESWQTGRWGENAGETWSATGNLLDILGNIKSKWGDIL